MHWLLHLQNKQPVARIHGTLLTGSRSSKLAANKAAWRNDRKKLGRLKVWARARRHPISLTKTPVLVVFASVRASRTIL